MDGEAPKTKRDLRRETTRSEILQIAGDMFLDVGFAGTSMSAIAARLGGSKGTLYNYFESKEELLEAFVRVLIGEAARIPELTRVFWDSGPQAKTRLLARRLEAARARGEFEAPDCDLAARQFLALARGAFYFERLLNLTSSSDVEAVRADIAASVDLFLKAYPARSDVKG